VVIFLIDKIKLSDFNKVFVSSKYKIKKLMGSEYKILTRRGIIYIGKGNYSNLPLECNKRESLYCYNPLHYKEIDL